MTAMATTILTMIDDGDRSVTTKTTNYEMKTPATRPTATTTMAMVTKIPTMTDDDDNDNVETTMTMVRR